MPFVASNMTLKCIKNGADPFGSSDNPYMVLNGERFKVVHTTGGRLGTFSGDLLSGESAVLVGPRKFGQPVSAEFEKQFSNALNFKLFDEDNPLTTGAFEFGPDQLIGETTYLAGGGEPLYNKATSGKDGFFVSRLLKGAGSEYQFSYRVSKLPGTTTGKVATDEGGLLNGSNKDGTLVGKSGKDLIKGNNGDDPLFEGANNDDLNDGNGDDKLSGGEGSDTFVSARNNGLDII
jgi:RTX calcium-binding nonapeptide repeat (4 copies)